MYLRRAGIRYFERTAIENFIGRALDGRRHDLDPKSVSLRNLAEVEGISLPEAYSKLIRNKTIGVCEHNADETFFDGMKVAFFRGARIRPGAQMKNAIKFAKARARLGTGLDGLTQLIEAGFLKCVQDDTGRSVICAKSMASFEQNYARAADYAPVLGCPPRSALKLLRKQGVEPINRYSQRAVCFVSRAEVERLAGVRLEGRTGLTQLEKLADDICEALRSQSIPATARVVSDPAIVIEATSRRWSFRVTEECEAGQLELVATFRATREARRLRNIMTSVSNPAEIWPGAYVESWPKGGFILIDSTTDAYGSPVGKQEFLSHICARAGDLHWRI